MYQLKEKYIKNNLRLHSGRNEHQLNDVSEVSKIDTLTFLLNLKIVVCRV